MVEIAWVAACRLVCAVGCLLRAAHTVLAKPQHHLVPSNSTHLVLAASHTAARLPPVGLPRLTHQRLRLHGSAHVKQREHRPARKRIKSSLLLTRTDAMTSTATPR